MVSSKVPLTIEQKKLSSIARELFDKYGSDGKYILDGTRLIICQSNANSEELRRIYPDADINPIGDWTGGTDVDSGATNRKLGSDMADSVTGGGLHGKDLSKADVSLNIYCFLKAQETGSTIELSCAIGDEVIDGRPYSEIVEIAREFISDLGGFEKFAEWGISIMAKTSVKEFKLVNVELLVPYANNARTHSKDRLRRFNHLLEFGFINPLIIDREYNVLAGTW